MSNANESLPAALQNVKQQTALAVLTLLQSKPLASLAEILRVVKSIIVGEVLTHMERLPARTILLDVSVCVQQERAERLSHVSPIIVLGPSTAMERLPARILHRLSVSSSPTTGTCGAAQSCEANNRGGLRLKHWQDKTSLSFKIII